MYVFFIADYDIPPTQNNNSKIQVPFLPTAHHEQNLTAQVAHISQSLNMVHSNQSSGSYEYIREPRQCVLNIERNKGLGFILSATGDYDHTITAIEKVRIRCNMNSDCIALLSFNKK